MENAEYKKNSKEFGKKKIVKRYCLYWYQYTDYNIKLKEKCRMTQNMVCGKKF